MIRSSCRMAFVAARRLATTPRQTLIRAFARQQSCQMQMQTARAFSTTRFFRSDAPEAAQGTEAEQAIAALLTDKLSPSSLLVQDISGGCGSMYAIDISSAAFKGLSILKQQRMVNAALGDVMKSWHGVQLRTSIPEE